MRSILHGGSVTDDVVLADADTDDAICLQR